MPGACKSRGMMLALMRQAAGVVADALFPPRCPLCDAFVDSGGPPCADCSASLCRLKTPAHIPNIPASVLSCCVSCFAHEGRIKDALHGFKYKERLDLAGYFATELFAISFAVGTFDAILPVPLFPARLKARGFNQSSMLAKGLGKLAAAPVDIDSLVRIRDVPPQVGLSREERVANVRGAFSVRAGREVRVAGKNLILVDDVMTTGATLAECARGLIAAGASSVSALTVARAL